MQHPMRRKDRALPQDETRTLLEKGEYGVLATTNEDGSPYAIPLSYVVMGQDIYIHCAKSGQKIENMAREPRACFTVVGDTRPVYLANFTTLYQSVVVHGAVRPVEDRAEKTEALLALCRKYLPQHMNRAPEDIAHSYGVTAVYAIRIERVTGKAKKPEAGQA